MKITRRQLRKLILQEMKHLNEVWDGDIDKEEMYDLAEKFWTATKGGWDFGAGTDEKDIGEVMKALGSGDEARQKAVYLDKILDKTYNKNLLFILGDELTVKELQLTVDKYYEPGFEKLIKWLPTSDETFRKLGMFDQIVKVYTDGVFGAQARHRKGSI